MARTIRIALFMALMALAAVTQAATWKTDPAHSAVWFTVKHMMISNVRGDFNTFDGTVTFDESKPETFTVEATAQSASIDTRNEKRNGHLKSPDFFDVEKYPTLTFKSTRVEKVADGKYKMTGDLTIHGVTKSVVFDVEGFSAFTKDPMGSSRTAATATTTIDRKDFGLIWNRPVEGGVLVGDNVHIELDVELVKQVEG